MFKQHHYTKLVYIHGKTFVILLKTVETCKFSPANLFRFTACYQFVFFCCDQQYGFEQLASGEKMYKIWFYNFFVVIVVSKDNDMFLVSFIKWTHFTRYSTHSIAWEHYHQQKLLKSRLNVVQNISICLCAEYYILFFLIFNGDSTKE